MMTSSNGNISALLALCAENSAATRSFDVFFDLRLNKRLSNQSWDWWFDTLWHSLLRHCNVITPYATHWSITDVENKPHFAHRKDISCISGKLDWTAAWSYYNPVNDKMFEQSLTLSLWECCVVCEILSQLFDNCVSRATDIRFFVS